MNEQLTRRLSALVSAGLGKSWTSVSYAVSIGGEVVAAESLGRLGGKRGGKATLDSTYNVASISKLYCTVAVLQLAERGLVSLDEPIVTYLPRFFMPDPRHRRITLRHCLNHASGLPGTLWRNFCVTDLRAVPDYYEVVYEYMANNCLKAEPGAFSVYCNDGFTLAEMVVAAVSGERYADYVRAHIAQPLGCPSTRASETPALPGYPLVRDGDKPAELLCIAGAGGLTTSMTDLCAFGRMFFDDSPVLPRAARAEMCRPQGVGALPGDARTAQYGLGWDTVCLTHPDYDLGAGALRKGGNSFQFTSQLIVLPAYRAVVAISETHDCGMPLIELALRLLAVALLERGVNITRRFLPVPEELHAQAGWYLTGSSTLELSFAGPFAELLCRDTRHGCSRALGTLRWDGKVFENADGQRLSLCHDGEDDFLLLEDRGPAAPMAQRAKPIGGRLPVAWKRRVGKGYLPISADAADLVIGEMCTSLRIRRLPRCEGVLLACFPSLTDGGAWEMFEAPFAPIDDRMGTGFLRTPANPSRDAVTPIFWTENGVEYCEAASYRYVETSFLPPCPARLPRSGKHAFVLARPLSEAPKLPRGRRVIVFDGELMPVWDSLTGKAFVPVKEGYLIVF